MYNSLIIAKNFILQISKNKINFLIYILMPPALAVLFMMMISSSNTYNIPIGIKDMDNTKSSAHIIEYIESSNKYKVIDYTDSFISDITEKNIRAGIIIKKGFEQSIIDGEPLEVELYSLEGVAVLGWLDAFLNEKISIIYNIGKSDKYYDILEQYKYKYLKLEVFEITDLSNKADASQSGFGMYLFASIFSIWGICALVYKEKIFKTYQRILTTPITHFQYAIGNMIASMAFAIAHMAISLPIIYMVFDMNQLIPIGKMIGLMISLYISIISLGILLVSLAKSQSSVTAINVLILTISSMLGGSYWSIEFMPQFMQDIAKVTPQYWFNTAILKMIQDSSIFLNIFMLLGFAIIYILIYTIIESKKISNL